jgi:hypothetical protein
VTPKAKLLPILLLIALPTRALPQSNVVEQFLSVPVWYLNYKVTVSCRDGGSGNDGSSWSIEMERVTSGSVRVSYLPSRAAAVPPAPSTARGRWRRMSICTALGAALPGCADHKPGSRMLIPRAGISRLIPRENTG